MTFIIMSMALSIVFMTLTHPLSLGITLLIQTLLISLMSGKLCYNFWFSYILFLIMVGGMLILFIYMTSIASNEKFIMKIKSMLPSMIMILSLSSPLFIMFVSDSETKNTMVTSITNFSPSLPVSMIKYTTFPLGIMLTFMIIYLFITLIAIVKIIDTKMGPLRSKN
uniref:NADH dehydrogenase subunit 6 n=1 Tax=Lagorina sericea TaxID=2908302 RepID=UPI001FA7EB9E|nr:NADH dehydrogenase subunit 6 [Lagorina sericea]UMR54883.1 NADH dehydrogenase subunit 6 [Lagorina sericea]